MQSMVKCYFVNTFSEFIFQIFTRQTLLTFRHIFWCSCHNKASSLVSTIRSQVDNMVSTLDNIKVMLNDKHRMSTFNQGIESLKQSLNIMEMQTRCWFIKDEERGLLLLLTNEISQFNALIFTT